MIALEPGQQWLSQFRLLKELAPAVDRRPSVWLAEKHGATGNTGTRVALKFLPAGPPSPLLVRRLADWRALHVAQFMPLLGVHTAGEQITLELPFLPEDNAGLRGAPYQKWSVWLGQVVQILAELHRENFVHGDLKLGNLRRDPQGNPVLADPWLPGDGRSPYTSSPERLKGGAISMQDDRYALGALLFELATGYPPGYPGVASSPAPALNGMPLEARSIMQALLSADPARRPSLDQVIDRLVPMNSTSPQQEGDFIASSPRMPDAHRTVILPARPEPRPTPRVRPGLAPAAPASASPAPASGGPAIEIEPRVVVSDPTIILRSSPPPPQISVVDLPVEPVPLAVDTPAWKHVPGPGVSSASPFQSRASVWRWPVLMVLLGAAIAAFVWLPEEMRQAAVEQVASVASRAGLIQQPAPIARGAPAATTPAATSAPAGLRSLAEQKLAAEQVRDQAQSLEAGLRDHGAAARPIATFVAGEEAMKQGLAAFDRRDFGTAHADFSSALQSLQVTQQAMPELYRRALADGDAALAQCLPPQALNEYNYALALKPDDEAAKIGIERAQVCEQVFAHVNAGAKAEQAGDAGAAQREYRAALQIDPRSSSAHDALARLNGQADDARFSQLLATALEGIRNKRYSAAITALAAAQEMHPDNADVQRLNQQLSDVRVTERLQALKAEAAQDERNERWQEALDAYRAMLAVDGTLALGLEGARRSQGRLQLDTELAGYIDHPERLSASDVREAADAALGRARGLEERGPRLSGQISRVGDLLGLYQSTVQVALRSDGITDVTIYRVGALGRFGQRSVSLKPGRYTVVGTRLGYHDVRREIEVVPGEKDVVVDIRCEEQI